jgi:uncharacterized membrane protein
MPVLPARLAGAALGVLACLATIPSHTRAQTSQDSPVDLVQVGLVVPAKLTVGKAFTVSDEVENAGRETSLDSVTGFFLSTDEAAHRTDVRLGAHRVPALQPGSRYSRESRLKVPPNVTPGTYYVIAFANADNGVEERYKTNNARAVKVEVVASR